MHIDIGIYTLKDISGIDNCNKLLNILSSHRLIIEKMGEYEPVKKLFCVEAFEGLWEGRVIDDKDMTRCDIIFKGSVDAKFTGMIGWGKNLHPKPLSVNSFSLWLNVKKSYDISNIISLADEIFKWAEADYGYISEKDKSVVNIQIQKNGFRVYAGNMYTGLYNLMWTNYFGKAYLAEENFNVPKDAVKLAHGVKIQLTDRPDDEKLSDLSFLKTYYNAMGDKWFWHFDEIVKDGRNYIAHLKKGFHQGEVSIPKFDRSAITRKTD